jgi:glycosyltransferase involved in cell wall biosynthesis
VRKQPEKRLPDNVYGVRNAKARRMRILVLSLFLPLPADNGVNMRTLAVLRALVAQGHRLCVLAFGDARDDQDAAGRRLRTALGSDSVELTLVPRASASTSLAGKTFRRLLHLRAALPASVLAARSQRFQAEVIRHINHGGIDVILCEQTDPLVNLPPVPAIPLIIDFHNVEAVIYRRYATCTKNPAKRYYACSEANKVMHWETESARRAAVALVCSTQDKEWLRSTATALPIIVAPNVLETESYLPKFRGKHNTLVYSGGMDWYPNRDAVWHFATEILPRVQREIPRAEFLVAGRNPPPGFRQRLERIPGVRFTGTVPDMKAVIGKASLAVVPLRIGSGTRLKILEAAALSKAVVSTSVGAEGLSFVPGKEIMLADDAGQFAEVVVDLLRDADRRRRLGGAARRRVEQSYSTRVLQAAVDEAIRLVQSSVPADPAAPGDPIPTAQQRQYEPTARHSTALGATR